MPRPLFQIAKHIAADWKTPSPQAKTYLKAMYYLLGMDDRIADLDAMTTVRMFLLYSKEWTGPVAVEVKAELQSMRSSHQPTNADLLASQSFDVCDWKQSHCELCHASLGTPAKLVDAHTHWDARARMCMHCALFVSPGVDLGDGGVFIADENGHWRHLHGGADHSVKGPVAPAVIPFQAKRNAPQAPRFRHRVKRFSRKVLNKCSAVLNRWLRRSA